MSDSTARIISLIESIGVITASASVVIGIALELFTPVDASMALPAYVAGMGLFMVAHALLRLGARR